MPLTIEDIGTPIGRDFTTDILDEKEKRRADNSLFYARQLGIDPQTAYDLEPELNVQAFGTKVITAEPGKMFFDAFKQSLADKPAMMLKGTEVYTPGRAMGMDFLLDKASTYLRSLQDPEERERLQKVASGRLWPTGEDRRWWQVEARYLPEVINTWAANVGDQIPIMLITQAGRTAGRIIGTPIALAAGGAAALVTGGPDPSDVVTAPAVVAIVSEVTKHLGGAAPMIAMEAGNFMDAAEALGLDRDISEKYAKSYGLGSGAIEYAQQLWLLGRYSRISKAAQATILKQVLSHIGGSLFQGVEELSQQGLENFLLQKAVAEMKERHPDFKGEAPTITAGMKRSGQIGAGVAFLTGMPGTGMTIANGALVRRQQAKPETKKFLSEPSVEEQARKLEESIQEGVEAAPGKPVSITGAPVEPSKAAPTPQIAKEEIAAPAAEEAKPEQVDIGGEIIDRAIRDDLIEKFVKVEDHKEGVKSQLVQELAEITGLNPNDITDLSPKAVGDLIDIERLPESQQETIRNLVTDYADATERLQKLQTERKRIDAPLREFEAQPPKTEEEEIKAVSVPEKKSLRDLGLTASEVSEIDQKTAKKKLNKPVDVQAFTPSAVQKEYEAKLPELTDESASAATVLEHYWREYDERDFEINVRTTKNQEAIASALNKKAYVPKADVEIRDASMAMMLYIDLKEHPAGHKFAREFTGKNAELYEQSQNLSAKLRNIADRIIEQNRKAGELAVEQGVIQQARENYIAHLWERTPRQETFFARFRQTTARARKRQLEGGIAEGLSRGMKLRITDVTLASQIAQSQVNQAFTGKKLLKMGKDWGLLSHQQEEDDWVQVEHPGFTTYKLRGVLNLGEPGTVKKGDWVRAEDRNNLGKVSKVSGNIATVHFINRAKGTEADIDLPVESLKIVRPRGRAFFITEEGLVMEKVPVYAEPVLGKKLNNIFAPSVLFKVPGVETLTRYNAIIKSTILYTSLFHHQAFLRSYAFGSQGLNPVKAFKKGRQAIMNMEPEVRLLVRNGLTLGRIQDYDPRMLEGEDTIWGKVFALTEPTDKVNEWLQNQRRKHERFLFNKLGPYLKIQAGLLELKAGLERNRTSIEQGEMTADDVARSVADLMNNDFGGLHLGRMGRNNTIQHLMRLMLLAPDWTESNVRSMIKAFEKGEPGYMHRMFWGRIAVKALGATILFNLLMSAFDDDDFAERYKKAWKEGRLRWLDVDITPIFKALGGKSDARKYFSLIGHFRDPVKFIVRPGASLKHKGSVVSRTMFDFASGQDWAGRKFTTVGELIGISEDGKLAGRLVKWSRGKAAFLEPSQLPSWFVYEARSAMPIPIQNIIAFASGEAEAFDAITKSVGLMTSTTFPKKTTGTVGRRTGGRRVTSRR